LPADCPADFAWLIAWNCLVIGSVDRPMVARPTKAVPTAVPPPHAIIRPNAAIAMSV